MKRVLFLFPITAGLALVTGTHAHAQSPATFDRNRDGYLDHDERVTFFMHRLKIPFSELDTDADGRISDAELKAARQQTEIDQADLERLFGARERYTLEEMKQYLARVEPTTRTRTFSFQIRQSPELRAFSAARPAIFSYARDFEDDTHEWSVKAAVLRPFRLRAGAADQPRRDRI